MLSAFWRVVVIGFIVVGLGGLATADVTIKVYPGNMEGWALRATGSYTNTPGGDGVAQMVNGPATPPLGSGSARLFTGTNGTQSAQIRTNNYAGTLLSSLTALSYSTYATSWNGQQLPYLTIWLDNGDRLWFEPPYQTPSSGNPSLPDQGHEALNTWQTWDALAGGWYTYSGFGGPGTNVLPLSAYLTMHPDVRIASTPDGSIRLASGFASPEDVFDAYVDNFTIGTADGTTTYDFEAVPAPGAVVLGMIGFGLIGWVKRRFA